MKNLHDDINESASILHLLQTVFDLKSHRKEFDMWTIDCLNNAPISDTGFLLIPTHPAMGAASTKYRNLDLLPFAFVHTSKFCPLKNYWCADAQCHTSVTKQALDYLGITKDSYPPKIKIASFCSYLTKLQSFVSSRWFNCPHSFSDAVKNSNR